MYKIALIGDIRTSREIQSRDQFQEKLKYLLTELNQQSSTILSPYTLTIGDEFQALFEKSNGILLECVKIIAGTYPEKVRISLGIGEITTAINRRQALGMDGPAFHNARTGIEWQKKLEKTGKRPPIFIIEGLNAEKSHTRLVKSSLSIFARVVSTMKKSSLEILIGHYKDISVKMIAKQLNISLQGVYKHIRVNDMSNVVSFMK